MMQREWSELGFRFCGAEPGRITLLLFKFLLSTKIKSIKLKMNLTRTVTVTINLCNYKTPVDGGINASEDPHSFGSLGERFDERQPIRIIRLCGASVSLILVTFSCTTKLQA